MEQESSSTLNKGIHSYAGLPPLVGLETMAGATSKGLPIAEAVARLKRLHWALKRLHSIFVSRITAMPIYELKMAFSLHAHYCIEHVGTISSRIREMRQPPYGLEVSPDAHLDLFFDEILSAPTTEALVLGLYGRAVPMLVSSLERFIADTNRLFDHQVIGLVVWPWLSFATYKNMEVKLSVVS